MIQSEQTLESPSNLRNWLLFILPSLIAVLLFIVPLPIRGEYTIPVAFVAGEIKSALAAMLPTLALIIVVFSALVTLYVKLLSPAFISERPFLNSLFNISPLWAAVRVLGGLFIICAYFQVGPAFIWSSNTGGMVFESLMPSLFSVFLLAGLLLPLLMDFGLLELLGALMTRVMRPVFNLPGRSAVNCIASWLGDGSVGILMSSRQYEMNQFTQREAAVIGTTFSAVSITFSLVVCAQVGLEAMFGPFYLTVCLAGIIAAIIVPKLPPLSRKKNVYHNGKQPVADAEVIPAEYSSFRWGVKLALEKVSTIQKPSDIIAGGFKNAVDMVVGVLPIVMGVGTMALIVVEYTPVLQILGTPFVPLLEWLQVPEAKAASATMVVGFTDMFLPSILASSTITSEFTRFVVAALSLTQLVYLSEVGALLLGSKIPVTFVELFIIFILRTLVTLPVIVLCAHFIF